MREKHLDTSGTPRFVILTTLTVNDYAVDVIAAIDAIDAIMIDTIDAICADAIDAIGAIGFWFG
jgi:hypothetical protein